MAKRRKAKRKSVVQIWSGNLPPMQRADFSIGCEFLTAAGRWRCTDIGKRTIAAIRLNHDDDPSWYNGPPLCGRGNGVRRIRLRRLRAGAGTAQL